MPASFADEAKLIGHFEKHGAEFGAKSSTEYLQVGKDIMQGGVKVQYLYKGEMRTATCSSWVIRPVEMRSMDL